MNRKHWEPDHPAVMFQTGDRDMARRRGETLEPHVVRWCEERDSEPSLAERRRAVLERAGRPRRDTIKGEALLGMLFVLTSGFVMNHAEEVGGDWWLLVGMLLGGGGAMIVDAIRRANP